MQKRGIELLALVLLLVSAVHAIPTENRDPRIGITRITDFQTDNIHILRLQNFSGAVVKEVSELQQNIDQLQEQISHMQNQLNGLNPAPTQTVIKEILPQNFDTNLNLITAQLVDIENQLSTIQQQPRPIPQPIPAPRMLFILNAALLIAVFGTVFYFHKNTPADDNQQEKHQAQHHLNNAILTTLNNGISTDAIRETFTLQGWGEKAVETAIKTSLKQKYG